VDSVLFFANPDPLVELEFPGCYFRGANRVGLSLFKRLTGEALGDGAGYDSFSKLAHGARPYSVEDCPFEAAYAKLVRMPKNTAPETGLVALGCDPAANVRSYQMFWFVATLASPCAKVMDCRLWPLVAPRNGYQVQVRETREREQEPGPLPPTPRGVEIRVKAFEYKQSFEAAELSVRKRRVFFSELLNAADKMPLQQAWNVVEEKHERVASQVPNVIKRRFQQDATKQNRAAAKDLVIEHWRHPLDAPALTVVLKKLHDDARKDSSLKYLRKGEDSYELRYLRTVGWQTALEESGKHAPENGREDDAVALVRSWQQDRSGYDQRTWPELARLLRENREFEHHAPPRRRMR